MPKAKLSKLSVESSILSVDDVLRDKSRSLIESALLVGSADAEKCRKLAISVEKDILARNGNAADYRKSIRSHLLALRDSENPLRENLLCGHIEPRQFADMSANDMVSPMRSKKDAEIRDRELKAHITKPLEIDINVLKDGRTREKWGVSESAAAVD